MAFMMRSHRRFLVGSIVDLLALTPAVKTDAFVKFEATGVRRHNSLMLPSEK